MGFPPLHKPFAPAITAAVVLPSISPKVITDVQTPFRSLRPHARTGNSVPEGSSSLGRAYRVGAHPGQKLASDGGWFAGSLGGPCHRSPLAVHVRHHHAVGGRG